MLTQKNGNRLANKLFLKVADLAALEGEYQQAIENYEKVANSSVSNNLMKWSVKDYFLKAGICHLASQVCGLFPSCQQEYALLPQSLSFATQIVIVLTLPTAGHGSNSTCSFELSRPRSYICVNKGASIAH